MAGQKKSRFELKAAGPWQLDPHLQELIRAQEAGPAISRAIAPRTGVADVIVRLKDDAKDKPPASLKKPRRIGGPQSAIVTGEIDIADIKATRKEVASIKAATKLYLNLHNSIPTIHCDSESLNQAQDDNGRTFPGLSGTDVIVGVVDFGCDFAHKNFLQPSGATRLLYLWDQSDPPPLDSSGAASPDHFDYGREFNSAKINEALQKSVPDPYAHLAYTPPLAAHGTHVMDIAAGNGREANLLGGVAGPGSASNPMSHPGVAPNAFLIFVHLKADGNQFLGNSRHLLEAVDYIFDKADRLGLPAVVNLSLSTSGGPHDGTTLVEQGFEELLKTPGRAIVVSAGNAYGQGGHVSGTIAGGQTQTLKWHTNPRASRNEMEVWYPGTFKDLTVALIPPGEDTPLDAVPLGKTKDLYEGETRRGRISHREDDPNNHDHQIDVRVPHLLDMGDKPWQIVLSNGGANDVTFHAWIEQDERGTAYFDKPTDNNFTLGSICCSEKTLTVGAFDTSEMAYLAPPYPATAAGPTRPIGNQPSRPKPELSAPGNNIVAARAHGGTTVMSGTSMAAAHVTGLVALLFERARRAGQGLLPIDTTRDILMGAANSSAVLSVNQEPRLGSGKIDGTGTLNQLLSVPPPAPPLQGIAAAPPVAAPAPAPAPASLSDQFRDLVDALSQANSFRVKVGNDGAPASEKLMELVGLLQQQDFELLVDPPA